MSFPSEAFLFLFLPFTVILYYGIFLKHPVGKNIFLFVMSILFYTYNKPIYVALLLLAIFTAYFFGILIHKFKDHSSLKRFCLVIAIISDVLFLGYFKYAAFFITNINTVFNTSFSLPDISLPIGISFYIFQAISYVVDTYRDDKNFESDLINLALYISFFPKLIEGPIVQYHTIKNEIKERKESFESFSLGINRFIIGIGKKVLLANHLGIVADAVFDAFNEPMNTYSVLLLWLGAISYTLQIFFDFVGYSDMAKGLGEMFGFHFPENFDYPYTSRSLSEFWRRWHMSLQTWFRDYVYIPLGGSRVDSKLRLIFNVFVVWLLTGIWHGANWTFIVWGLLNFVLLIIERFTKIDKRLGAFNHVYTMFFVILGWVLFRSDTISEAFAYIGGMFGIGTAGFIDKVFLGYIRQFFVYYVVGIICCFPVFKKLDRKFSENTIYDIIYTVILLAIFCISIMFVFNNAYSPFIYSDF